VADPTLEQNYAHVPGLSFLDRREI
jgi:hypothetical protein